MHDFQLLETIVTVVAESARLKSPKQLFSASRAPALVKLRDTAIFLIRKRTQLSLPEIGRAFGRDHSSIHTAINREEIRLVRNPPRGDKLTWTEYHARLLAAVDKLVAETMAAAAMN